MINWHKTVKFIQDDWYSHPMRLCLEIVNWFLNLVIVILFAITVPDVPYLFVYPMFLVCLTTSMYAAWSRGSFGLLLTSITIFIVDMIAYIKLLLM